MFQLTYVDIFIKCIGVQYNKYELKTCLNNLQKRSDPMKSLMCLIVAKSFKYRYFTTTPTDSETDKCLVSLAKRRGFIGLC